MLDIPYIQQPDSSSCAMACYTMVAQYFFPETTFEEIKKIVYWEPGYVVWAFPFWLWIMDKGIKIIEVETLDYGAWAREGVEGLRRSVPEKEFDYYVKRTKDFDSLTQDMSKVIEHANFKQARVKPTFSMLKDAMNDDKICEVVLDSRTLRGKSGFALHRLVILSIEGNTIAFHDPSRKTGGPKCKVTLDLFKKAWLESVDAPELCIYSR